MKNRILAVLLAVTMALGAIPAQAAASETASTPVELTAEAASFSVEIPTSLPVSVDRDGNVSVADNVVIMNNSPAPVRLESMRVEPAEGWTLVPMDTDFSEKPVDTKEMALSLFGSEVAADGSVDVSGVDVIAGAGGAARAAMNATALDYDAKCGVFRNAGAMTAAKVTSVIGFEAEETAEPEPEALADYAVLYSDGTLAFQAGNEPKGGYGTIVDSWTGEGGWATEIYTFDNGSPWHNSSNSIAKVEFIDKTIPKSLACWFDDCSNLVSIDMTMLDTSDVTNMCGMFSGCSKLRNLNVSDFNTSNVTSMMSMFYGCSGLTNIDISNFDTSNVTDMFGMFYNCSGLKTLDIGNFNTVNVRRMHSMFQGCSGLISLDLSNFDTSQVTNIRSMFYECSNLVTIYADNKFVVNKVIDSTIMFGKCYKLVGGNGTKYSYNSSNQNKTYARIDLPGQPGYFTAKA